MSNQKTPERTDIPVGRQYAVTREGLAKKWGLGDRKVREIIAGFRADINNEDDGYAILSSSVAPAGYWRSDNPEELREYIGETERRAKSNFTALRGARRLLNRIESRGQVTMGSMLGGVKI